MIAEILTPWVGDGSVENPFRAKLVDDFHGMRCTDVTSQAAANLTPDPNLLIARVDADELIISAINIHPDYEVLWNE